MRPLLEHDQRQAKSDFFRPRGMSYWWWGSSCPQCWCCSPWCVSASGTRSAKKQKKVVKIVRRNIVFNGSRNTLPTLIFPHISTKYHLWTNLESNMHLSRKEGQKMLLGKGRWVLTYLISVECWRTSGTAVLDSSFQSHEEVDVAVVLLIAEVNVVLDINAARQGRSWGKT